MLVTLWKIGEHFKTRNHNELGESEFIFFHFRSTTCYVRRRRSLILSVCFLFCHQESNWFVAIVGYCYSFADDRAFNPSHFVSSFRIALWVLIVVWLSVISHMLGYSFSRVVSLIVPITNIKSQKRNLGQEKVRSKLG